MSLLNSHNVDSAHDLLDYEVVDQSGTNIGTLHALWADSQTGQLNFIGVKTGWLFGQTHVVPVDQVQIDDNSRTLRIPYESDFIQGAPSVASDATISDAQEAEIYRYYQIQGHSAGTATAAGETSYAGSGATASAGAAGLTATGAGAGGTAGAGQRTATATDSIEVPLSEEQVRVGKRTVEAGQVRLRKIVRTEVVNQPVEVRHEDVVVERVSADEVRSGAAGTDFTEEVINVPLTREEVVVQKDSHVTGAVRVHKTSEAEQQNVSETVRKEDVEVVREGETATTAGTRGVSR